MMAHRGLSLSRQDTLNIQAFTQLPLIVSLVYGSSSFSDKEISLDALVPADFRVAVCPETRSLMNSKKVADLCPGFSCPIKMGVRMSKLFKGQDWNWKFPFFSSRSCFSSSFYLTSLPSCKPHLLHSLIQHGHATTGPSPCSEPLFYDLLEHLLRSWLGLLSCLKLFIIIKLQQ